MSGDTRDKPLDSIRKNASKGDDSNATTGRPAKLSSAVRGRTGAGSSGSVKPGQPPLAIDVVMERRGRGYAVMIGERMISAGEDGDSFYRAVLLALGQTRGDTVASHDIQALRNDVADTLIPRLNSGLLRIWWQNRKRRTGLTPERYLERYIRSPGSWDEPLAQLLPIIVPSCATWRRLGGERLMVDMPGYGRHADQSKKSTVVAIRASDLWNDFVKGDATVFAPMQRQVLRDKSLPISALTRPVRMTLNHHRDAVEMRTVPTHLTVVFAALNRLEAAMDHRNLILLPSSTTLVDSGASLPAIDVAQVFDEQVGSTYIVTDGGSHATVRFIFAPGVACPAIDVLDTLKRAADVKHAALTATLHDLMTPAGSATRPPARRAALARLWNDLSDEVRRRVLAGFSGREGLAAVELDVVAELKSGTEPARMALAIDMLIAGLDLWQIRCDISRIPFSFWRAEMTREMPPNPDGQDFILARARVQESFTRWRAIYADLKRWLGDPAIGGNTALSDATRDCVSGALTRGDETGTPVPVPLRSVSAHELRSRLFSLHQDLMRQRDQKQAESPAAITAALTQCAEQLCGSGRAAGELAEAPAATGPSATLPVSVLWPQLVADTSRDVLRLDSHAARDHAIDLSLMNRRATLVLDHPGDVLQMSRVPPDLSVRFEPSGPGSVGSDQRWLFIAPGKSEFLDRFGPLPVISVTLSKGDNPGWEVYNIFDMDRRTGCNFIFTGNVASRVRTVLEALRQAASVKWTQFRKLYFDLSDNPQIGQWDAARRAMAATCWNAFPESTRHRALGYYGINVVSEDLREMHDIGDALAKGRNAARIVVARQALMSAMDYWDLHGELDEVTEPFWDDMVRRQPTNQLSPTHFAEFLESVQREHRQWQETAPLFNDLLQWLAQPALEGDVGYGQLRRCLLRATLRAAGFPVHGSSAASDSLALSSPAQVRARLARVKQAVQELSVPAAMATSRVLQRLPPWMTRIGGTDPILLDATTDRLDELAIEEHCVPAGMGVRAVSYLLDEDLPAERIAGLFAIGAGLLADGTLPLEMLGKSDEGVKDDQRWWRSYRFSGAWKYDADLKSWCRAQHEMNVEGTVIAQRDAFDRHMNGLLEEMVSGQSLYFFSNDRQVVELSGRASYILAPQSQFAQRTVYLQGAGTLLILPPGLQGDVRIDLSRLESDADAQLEAAPQLLARLQPPVPVQLDAEDYLRYHYENDDTLALHIGPQERKHPLCLTLDTRLRESARRQLIYDLADEVKNVVLVDAILDDEIVLPPMTRDVFIYPLGKSSKFIIRELGSSRMQLLVTPPVGATTADICVQLEFALEVLPRYGISEPVLGQTGYLTAAVRDNQSNGTLLLCCAPGVNFEREIWRRSVLEVTAIHNRYVDDFLDWDDRLLEGKAFPASDLVAVQRYGTALTRQIDETMRRRAVILSSVVERQQQDRLVIQQPGRVREAPGGNRSKVSGVLAQMLMFSFSRAFDRVTLPQWTEMVQARDAPLMTARLIGMYVDMIWERDQVDEFYSGLAGFFGFLSMSSTDDAVQTTLARDENCIDAALDLIAGKQVSDELMMQVGLTEMKDPSVYLIWLKLILVTRLDEKLFDDDPLWRDQLLNDLRNAHVRARRQSAFDLLASIMSGRGGRDAVMLAYQHQKLSPISRHAALPETEPRPDVIVFDQLSTMKIEPGTLAARSYRLNRSAQQSDDEAGCRLASAVNFAGALLIFIGDAGTALSRWYINHEGSRTQRYTTMYFQVVKALGWAGQQGAGFACQPAAEGAALLIQATAPTVGMGMSVNYLAGGISELLVRRPRTSWTWRGDMRPLAFRIPGRRANKIMQLVDLAGNIYLLVADSSRIATLQEQAEKAEGSEVISATFSCSSAALGSVTAAGELGAKALLSPARKFYQAVGISSAMSNLCGAVVGVETSGGSRTDDRRPEL
jgi:hypothetical protein